MKRNSRNNYSKALSNKTEDGERPVYMVFLKVWLLEFGFLWYCLFLWYVLNILGDQRYISIVIF